MFDSLTHEVDEKLAHAVNPATASAPTFVPQEPQLVAQRQRRHQWQRRRFTLAVLAIFTVVEGLSRVQKVVATRPFWTAAPDRSRFTFINAVLSLVASYPIIALLAHTAASARWPKLHPDGRPIPMLDPPAHGPTPSAIPTSRKLRRDLVIFIMWIYVAFCHGLELLGDAFASWVVVLVARPGDEGTPTLQELAMSTFQVVAAYAVVFASARVMAEVIWPVE